MRIGILTFHSSYNFGANLQALGLQSTVQALGGEVEIIDYREPHKLGWYEKNTLSAQAEAHERFMSRYMVLSPRLSTPREVEDYVASKLDGVLVGSDAVFRVPGTFSPRIIARKLLGRASTDGLSNPEEFRNLTPYWLYRRGWEQGAGVPHASIAASAEASRYYYAHPSLFGQLFRAIRAFDYLSVRDDWAAKMLRLFSLGTRSPELCPDPVFGLNRAFSIPPEEGPPVNLDDVVLLSGKFAPAWVDRFVEAAHTRKFRVANLPNPDKNFGFPQADIHLDLPMTPLQWFRTLGSASAFVGIRFHALVSCITNGTPAFALDNLGKAQFGYRKRSKVYDLCRRAGVAVRYGTVPSVQKMDPGQVLDLLAEGEAQKRADEYAEWAVGRLREVVSTALQRMADKRLSAKRTG